MCEDVDTSDLVELPWDAVGVKKILYTEDTEEEIQASVVEAKAITVFAMVSFAPATCIGSFPETVGKFHGIYMQ